MVKEEALTTSNQPIAPDFGYGPASPNRKLWKWSLVLCAVILLFLTWQCGSALREAPRLTNQAVRHFHQQLNLGHYEEIYREADHGFSEGGRHEELLTALEAVHAKLGDAGDETLLNIRVKATTSGTALRTQYNTTFARGSAIETFTWIKKDGGLKLYGYSVESKELLVN